MLPATFIEDGTTESAYSFVITAKEKVLELEQLNIDSEYIDQLSVLDIDNVYDVIQTENLTEEQAQNLVKTWAENEAYGVDAEPPVEIEPNFEKGVSDRAYSGSITPVGNVDDNTGYHYIVRSVPGYNKATGYFSLPTTTVGSAMPSSNPDVPYGHFGLYTEDNNVGLDLGTVLFVKEGYWRFYIQGYVKYSDNATAIAQNSGQKYTKYYKELAVNGTTYKYTKSKCPRVYMIANAIKKTGYDTYRLTAINAADWSTIGEININTNEKGYQGDPNRKNLAPNKSYLTSNCSNCRVHREVTLAYASNPERVLTGTSVMGAKWDNVYIYSPTVTTVWGTAPTRNAQYVGKTLDRAKKVSTTIATKWSEDTTNIVCK